MFIYNVLCSAFESAPPWAGPTRRIHGAVTDPANAEDIRAATPVKTSLHWKN